MQTGTVLYVTHAATLDDPDQLVGEAEKYGLHPPWVEVAASAPGWPTPQDAILALTERGARRIEFRAAFLESEGVVRLASCGTRVQG
jgi:hypothetical protein